MQITVSGKNIEVSKALREQVEKKLNKLSARYDTLVSANVILSVERRNQIVQVTVFGKGTEYRAQSESEDLYRSISEAADKLEKQIAKSSERPIAKRIREVVDTEGMRLPMPVLEPVEVAAKSEGNVKTIKVTADAMTVDEAMKVLEEKGHVFYTFYNVENDRINVVYNSERGVCLIDPIIPEE